MEHDCDLSNAALSAIKDMLVAAKIPPAMFIDDYVGNLLFLYQEAIKENGKLREELSDLKNSLPVLRRMENNYIPHPVGITCVGPRE